MAGAIPNHNRIMVDTTSILNSVKEIYLRVTPLPAFHPVPSEQDEEEHA